MEVTTLDQIRCGVEDGVMGARCTLLSPHDPPHKDESDPECVFSFRDEKKLIVPTIGTDFDDFDAIEPLL